MPPFSSRKQWRLCFVQQSTRKKKGLKETWDCKKSTRGVKYKDLPETKRKPSSRKQKSTLNSKKSTLKGKKSSRRKQSSSKRKSKKKT